MGVHGVQCFGQVTRSAVKQVFPSSSAPKGVTVKAVAQLRTQLLDISLKAVFLKDPSLHGAPQFHGYHR